MFRRHLFIDRLEPAFWICSLWGKKKEKKKKLWVSLCLKLRDISKIRTSSILYTCLIVFLLCVASIIAKRETWFLSGIENHLFYSVSWFRFSLLARPSEVHTLLPLLLKPSPGWWTVTDVIICKTTQLTINSAKTDVFMIKKNILKIFVLFSV